MNRKALFDTKFQKIKTICPWQTLKAQSGSIEVELHETERALCKYKNHLIYC